MMRLRSFYPKKQIDSAYVIPYERFYKKGIRGVIFDVDNTLVPHGAPADSRAITLFEELRSMGIDTCLMSNNKEPRVSSFAAQVKSKYIYKAGKPALRGYHRAMELMGTDKDSTLFVGDQLFTDVYGANRAGIYGILVNPIDKKEEFQIVLKRYPERMVLYFYKRDRKREKLQSEKRT